MIKSLMFAVTRSKLMICAFFQVAASMQKDIDAHVPNYPNLPSKLICLLHNVTLHVKSFLLIQVDYCWILSWCITFMVINVALG